MENYVPKSNDCDIIQDVERCEKRCRTTQQDVRKKGDSWKLKHLASQMKDSVSV